MSVEEADVAAKERTINIILYLNTTLLHIVRKYKKKAQGKRDNIKCKAKI